MSDGAVVVGVTGIVVSGVVGPLVASWIGRKTERRAFTRARFRDQRDELRDLFDEAATLLSVGPRVLRRRASNPDDAESCRSATEWSDQVFPLRERLLLRLPPSHDAVTTYDQVRTAAQTLAEQPTAESEVSAYESARDAFLRAARAALDAPIPEKQT